MGTCQEIGPFLSFLGTSAKITINSYESVQFIPVKRDAFFITAQSSALTPGDYALGAHDRIGRIRAIFTIIYPVTDVFGYRSPVIQIRHGFQTTRAACMFAIVVMLHQHGSYFLFTAEHLTLTLAI